MSRVRRAAHLDRLTVSVGAGSELLFAPRLCLKKSRDRLQLSGWLSQTPVRAPPHTMPPVARLEASPTYVVQEEHTELQSSTPNSFSDLPPLLVLELNPVLVKLQPVPAALNGDEKDELVMEGRLWVTEQSLSFLPSASGSTGFQIPFPSIALHAVSRSVPDDVLDKATDAGAYSSESCIYCQLDDHPERDEDEDEEEETIFELWILVRDADTCMLCY